MQVRASQTGPELPRRRALPTPMACRGLTLVLPTQCRAWLSPNRAEPIPFHRQAEGCPPGPRRPRFHPRRNPMSRTADRSNEIEHGPGTSQGRPQWRCLRVVSVGAAVGAFAVMGSLTLTSVQESSAATTVRAVVPAGARFDAPAPTASMPADMPGMDMSGSAPAPTASMPADMPGMDRSGGNSPAPSAPAMSPDMPGMDMSGSSTGVAAHRPLAPVLGTFGGASAAVLFAAGMVRRKDLGADLAKKAARISGRGKK